MVTKEGFDLLSDFIIHISASSLDIFSFCNNRNTINKKTYTPFSLKYSFGLDQF
jgi:hypothetical protein